MRKVKEFMKKKVLYFTPGDSIFEVAKKLSHHNISGAPVIDKDKVIGVISDADIIKFMKLELPEESGAISESELGVSLMFLDLVKRHLDLSKELKKMSSTKIKDLMSTAVVSIDPEASIHDAATLMQKSDVHRLPVIDDKGKLVGIISRADLIRALVA
jgi:CBS domain-containing protein